MLIRKSQPYMFLIYIGAVILIGIVYAVLSTQVSSFYNINFNKTEVVNDQVYQTFFMRMQTMWIWLPFIIAIGLFLWAIIKAHQREEFR